MGIPKRGEHKRKDYFSSVDNDKRNCKHQDIKILYKTNYNIVSNSKSSKFFFFSFLTSRYHIPKQQKYLIKYFILSLKYTSYLNMQKWRPHQTNNNSRLLHHARNWFSFILSIFCFPFLQLTAIVWFLIQRNFN